jgi:hypothetical protein
VNEHELHNLLWSYAKATALVCVAAVLGLAVGVPLKRKLYDAAQLKAILNISGTAIAAIAGIGRLGWSIQSWGAILRLKYSMTEFFTGLGGWDCG